MPVNDNIIARDVGLALHPTGTVHPLWLSDLLQILKIIAIQLKICWLLITISSDIDLVIYHTCGPYSLLPLLISKGLGKPTSVSASGLASQQSYSFMDNGKRIKRLSRSALISKMMSLFERAVFSITDQIAVETEIAITTLKLEEFEQKIVIRKATDIEAPLREQTPKIEERSNLVGFFGRLAPTKNILGFVDAIPLVLERSDTARFVIGGDGPLLNAIASTLEQTGSSQRTELVGWVPHEQIFDHLRKLKLLVLPSYAGEGLPRIVLEAMACGTPVLATPVGGIADVIEDGVTGFILAENSPKCIARNVIMALDHGHLDNISKKAREAVSERYSLEASIERFRESINELVKGPAIDTLSQ
jgi:glycosyltransferase involved in cell wall biosynthesis